MERIEKTVFISYRRTDVYTALAVYEDLKNQGYDVFFDYRSISSGDFEQIITSSIKARAHFILILTPTALDRCNKPGDWLRREIEIAIDEKRNIVPLFFKGFRFGAPSVSERLTGKLKSLSHYNGLNVHEDYFDEAMQRLREQFLSQPLDMVLHPVSKDVQKKVQEVQIATDKKIEENNKYLASRKRLVIGLSVILVLIAFYVGSYVRGHFSTFSPTNTPKSTQAQAIMWTVTTGLFSPTTVTATETPHSPWPTNPVGKIVFTCTDAQSYNRICIMNADGSEQKQLTVQSATLINAYYPSLSHDGQTIYFSQQVVGSQSGFEIYSMDTTGHNLMRLTHDIGELTAPELSPNGKQIVFVKKSQGIWLMKSNGQNPHSITSNNNDIAPTWSPDGSMIAFISSRTGKPQLYIMKSDGSDLQKVTNLDNIGGRSTWSPDGKELAFFLGPQRDRNIYVIDVDENGQPTGQPKQLTTDGDNISPSWSPDGNWIAFTSFRDGNNEIYIMHPDGKGLKRLTNNSRSDIQPRWGE